MFCKLNYATLQLIKLKGCISQLGRDQSRPVFSCLALTCYQQVKYSKWGRGSSSLNGRN